MRILFLSNIPADDKAFKHCKLSSFKKAKQISIDLTEMPSDFQLDMRALLPMCDVHIGVHIPEQKK